MSTIGREETCLSLNRIKSIKMFTLISSTMSRITQKQSTKHWWKIWNMNVSRYSQGWPRMDLYASSLITQSKLLMHPISISRSLLKEASSFSWSALWNQNLGSKLSSAGVLNSMIRGQSKYPSTLLNHLKFRLMETIKTNYVYTLQTQVTLSDAELQFLLLPLMTLIILNSLDYLRKMIGNGSLLVLDFQLTYPFHHKQTTMKPNISRWLSKIVN